ncbi:MAG: 7-carboxy-7-deazaguanine synthase QueE [Planctomycetes bacterium]|nr:7-carboxy-7-deazaguanine synthase QueE [Planctomycetota bacterium]
MGTSAPESSPRAPVLEVFSSIQGEGAFVGEPQVFLRLRGCPLRCRWCDTPGSWTLPSEPTARIARPAGARRDDAWATPFQAACWIAEVEPGAPRTVSVTGGEPLLWPAFVLGLKPMLGRRRLHLETAGAHPRALDLVLPACDHVSLDLKPDFDLDPPVELAHPRATPERAPRDAAEWAVARTECLRLVAGRDACGKLVVSGGHPAEAFAPILDEVERHASGLLVVVQPASPVGGVEAPSQELVDAVAEMARDRELPVRVLPQVHRLLGIP